MFSGLQISWIDAFFVAVLPAVAFYLYRQLPGLGGRRTLTRVTHLVPDASGTWLHVFGAERLMPEDGVSSDVWYHLMVEPRSGRWVSGAGAQGPDLKLRSAFVDQSMAGLAPVLGFAPALAKGGELDVTMDGPTADARPLKPPRKQPRPIRLAISASPPREMRISQACRATLHIDGKAISSHQFAALPECGFEARTLSKCAVGFFSYVGTSFPSIAARLVAIDLNTGAVLFDVPCRYRASAQPFGANLQRQVG